jgi:hypothetical protein
MKIVDTRVILAWEEYERILDKYHALHSVRNYDRVSIHDAFPEIKKAFEGAVQIMAWVKDYTKKV